jgi:hypothetical protein
MLALIEKFRRQSPPWFDSRATMLVFLVIVPTLLIVAFAIANAHMILGENGPYIVVGILLILAFVFALLLDWRLGALTLAATLPFEEVLTFGPVVSVIKGLALLTLFSLGSQGYGDYCMIVFSCACSRCFPG